MCDMELLIPLAAIIVVPRFGSSVDCIKNTVSAGVGSPPAEASIVKNGFNMIGDIYVSPITPRSIYGEVEGMGVEKGVTKTCQLQQLCVLFVCSQRQHIRLFCC